MKRRKTGAEKKTSPTPRKPSPRDQTNPAMQSLLQAQLDALDLQKRQLEEQADEQIRQLDEQVLEQIEKWKSDLARQTEQLRKQANRDWGRSHED